MEDEYQYFLWLSGLVNESLIKDLSKEVKPTPKKEEKPSKKLNLREPKPEKESKVQNVTLEARQDSDDDEQQQKGDYDDDEESGSDTVMVDNEGNEVEGEEEGQFRFSAIAVPVKPDLNLKKGKNKYQKLREARRQEKIDAVDPEAAKQRIVSIKAAGGKVPQTVAQVEKSMKKEKQEKKKRFEKRTEKEAKEKRKEDMEAKKDEKRKFDRNAKKFSGGGAGGKKFGGGGSGGAGGKKFGGGGAGGKKFGGGGGKKFDKGGKKNSTRPSFKGGKKH